MARAFVRLTVTAAALAFTPAAAAETSAAVAPTTTAQGLDFQTLVDLGDAARAQGKSEAARRAYLHALTLRPNEPTVLGRLGLTAAELGQWVRAVELLHDAIEGNGGDSDAERETFGKMFTRARNEIGLVRVKLNVVGAVVRIDAERLTGTGAGFVAYLEPGRHVLRVEAPGFAPYVQAFMVTKGGTLPLDIEMQRVPEPSPDPAPSAAPAREPVGPSPSHSPRFLVGLGASLAGGFAPGSALGPVGLFEVRWPVGSIGLSVGLDARGVMGLGRLELAPNSALWSVSATLPVCVHAHRVFLCGLGQIEAVITPGVTDTVRPLAGGGARVGTEFVWGAFGVRAWGDVVVRPSPPDYSLGGVEVWRGSPIAGALSIAGVLTL
ncbi:PEGA domain-containing protein [Polyangium sorediatum]|uniref:PEGA domain-containing protein n=1 Tax=Polyangium sorediatum TaxID=889274 RepID=A0ABT6NL45_9BACT|nr:PEGA domain-containing protein [Polyangium sorediatum]MDI1429040.1 PEGA domain-containing protein [Polyangium sorediatum]